MRKCVLALLVASSLVIVTAAQDQVPGGAPRPQQPGAQGEQPRPAPPSTQGERPTAPAGAQAASKVTISGCIQNAPTASATPGGAAAPSGPAAKWVLANAKAAAGGSAVGTAGSATATRYQLEGEEKAITPHVNHQVEITGTVQPAGAGAAAGAAAAGPMLKVESVKMIADKCS